ncbi:MAG: DUF4239 domain-containing protein [Proteobacteria bacterium]|nr:DUF4239 domain-containing protein [Pseudomonadota bacterium]
MSSIEIVNALPVWMLALLVIGAAVCFSVSLQLLTRWYFGVDVLAQNNEVAGFKFAVVGVAYGVLLAFVVIVVWNDFDRAQQAVYSEAERFYNLHRTSFTFPEGTGQKIRQDLVAYAIDVRDKDWPLMEKGERGSPAAAKSLSKLSFDVGQAKPESLGLVPSVIHAFELMQQIADFRLERLSAVGGQVTSVIWWVLLLGAFINLGYPAFFATKNVAAQILMTGGLAAIIGGTLFLTINLNYPFSGPERLTSQPIDDVIQLMRIENTTSVDQH